MAKTIDEGFFHAKGMHYLNFFEVMHKVVMPEWYLEIGTQTGASLRYSEAKSVSVDPEYLLTHEIIGNKPALFAFQETSDDFFRHDRLKQIGATINMAFLDGMHLFEYLLRDFIGTEKSCAPNAVILMHGCLPWNNQMAFRNRSTVRGRAWTGDVWKIVPILKKYRPELNVEVVDAEPTGLVIVTGLDPSNTVLEDNYDNIMAEFMDCDIESYGVERYFSSLDVQSAAKSRWLCAFPQELGDGWRNNPDISIKIAAPTRDKMTTWGDYHYAKGLAREFCRLGYRTYICAAEDWYVHQEPGGIDLVLRGRSNFKRQARRLSLFWAISKRMRPVNFNDADHVFYASKQIFDVDSVGLAAGKSSILPQAFDSEIMKVKQGGKRSGVAFVGRARSGFERVAVTFAAAANADLKIWGPGWQDGPYKDHVVAEDVPNDELPDIYQSAKVVLNDHTPTMRDSGFLSNRVFDALACGAIPLSEDVGWLPDGFEEFVYVFDDQDSFEAGLAAALAEPAAKQKKRAAFAREIASNHSFAARARQILDVAEDLNAAN